VQFSRLTWGERFAIGTAGDVTTGAVIDDRPTRGTGMPEMSFGWGLPNGLFGYQAELYGRFTFLRATTSEAATVANTAPGAFQSAFQFVAPFNLTSLGASATQSGVNALTGSNVVADRSQTSYDGWIGARVHIQSGRWTFSPMFEIGYQRLEQEDSMTVNGGVGAFSTAFLTNLNQLDSNYYRVGIGVGVAYPVSMSVAAFAILRGSLDVAHHDYTGTTSGFQPVPIAGGFTGGTSDDSTRVSGRGSLRAGLAFLITPNLVLSLSGNVAYIGSVPYVVYGTNSPIASPFYSSAGPARIATQSQVNAGASMGATIRF
jgi:hypothetical protein